MIDMDSEFKIGDRVIKEKGKLLSLTASEAMQTYGDPAQPLLGAGIAENLDALLDRIHGAGNYSVQTFEVSWSERLAQYLVAITPLLLGIGMLALFIELKTPGFGVFGISGIILLGIVFFGQSVAGLSGHEPALFFLLGLALLMAELFLFPGTLVLAMAGVVLMLGSLVWAMSDLWPNEAIPLSGDVFVRPLASVIGGMVLAVVLFAAVVKYLPQGGIWGKMILDTAVGGEPGAPRPLAGGSRESSNGIALIGQVGIAATPLFPSGQVEIGGRRYEARLGMGFADAGTAVKVTGLAEFGLKVEVLS
jgi:membrane-bound serine protease (ClpP class)